MAMIDQQITSHGDGIIIFLAEFERDSTIAVWRDLIRKAEEFINLVEFEISEPVLARYIRSLPLDLRMADSPQLGIDARKKLEKHFSASVARRFESMVFELTSFSVGMEDSGRPLSDGFQIATVADGVQYLQSRRRQLVSVLYLMNSACVGNRRIGAHGGGALTTLGPMVEHCCTNFTSWHWQKIYALCIPNQTIEITLMGARVGHDFLPLDAMHLEPERASILDMAEHRPNLQDPPKQEPVDPRLVLSAPELRNQLRQIRHAYAAFDLADREYQTICMMISLFSRHCRDDYYIELSADKFASILRCQTVFDAEWLHVQMLNVSTSFAEATNGYEPFIEIGGKVLSSVTLLLRLAYEFKNRHLESRRRFQIHAGFIFENMVSKTLEHAGFTDMKITRINRREFDVVTVKNNTIHNFQCKNNWIDITKVESDPRLYARYNRRLVSSYRRALAKEKMRERLLQENLGINRICHYVVSRFPVITDEPAIINFNTLAQTAETLP